MKTLGTAHHRAVNKATHAAAARFKLQTRCRWINDLTGALKGAASFVELQQRIAQLASSDGEHPDSAISAE